jgi:hypothetical protein
MLAQNSIGVFYRQLRGGDPAEIKAKLADRAGELEAELGIPMGDSEWYFFGQEYPCDYSDPDQRQVLIRWLREKADHYERTIEKIFG